jgi:predicted Rossmann fold flavoprotein
MVSGKSSAVDVVVVGAGAAGLMCAIECAKRGRQILLLEKAEKPGKKILISGGGRCNFTNIEAAPEKYVSGNGHYCKSALRQYTQRDFIALMQKHGISFHEKKLGQLFCDEGAGRITQMLLEECEAAGVTIWCNAGADKIVKQDDHFLINVGGEQISAASVVIASGGLSIPKMGANDFAHRLAQQNDLKVTDMIPGLVPFTFEPEDLARFAGLTGVSADIEAKIGKTVFRENILFTHRGISGPAILQISSFWSKGQSVFLDFLPDIQLLDALKQQRASHPRTSIKRYIGSLMASKLAEKLMEPFADLPEFANCSDKVLGKVARAIKEVQVTPNGTEGYRKAEVTVGGVDTKELSSKTMEVKKIPGLYFIGEAVDVTGFLGGYNFQWAWSSGFVAGQNA